MTSTLDLTRRVDLLLERRQELNLAPPGEVVREQRQVLRRACLWGGGIVAVAAVLGLLVTAGKAVMNARLDEVKQVEAQLATLQSDLESSSAKLEKQQASNNVLARALATTPSGAALMRDLQERVPEGVQLSDLTRSSSSITLVGLVQDPVSFVRINAFELQLAQSPLLNEPKLLKATREKPVGPGDGTPGMVSFQIEAKLRDLAGDPALEATLRRLGSEGMVKRLQLLRKEGLMP